MVFLADTDTEPPDTRFPSLEPVEIPFQRTQNVSDRKGCNDNILNHLDLTTCS